MAASAPQYDDVAHDYERLIAPRYARVAEAIVGAMAIRPDDAILDVGAGTGGVSRLVLRYLGRAGRLVLLDVSPGMLEVARAALSAGADAAPASHVEYVVGDLAALPLESDGFGHVVAQFTPLQDTPAGLAEASRVLRHGGRLTVAYWGPDYRELDLLNRVRAQVGIDAAVPPDRGAVAARAAAAGFRDVRTVEHRFAATYPDADAYLAYRAAFGRAIGVDDETWRRYWDALSAEVRRMDAADGGVRLDWSVELLTAERS